MKDSILQAGLMPTYPPRSIKSKIETADVLPRPAYPMEIRNRTWKENMKLTVHFLKKKNNALSTCNGQDTCLIIHFNSLRVMGEVNVGIQVRGQAPGCLIKNIFHQNRCLTPATFLKEDLGSLALEFISHLLISLVHI